MQKLTATNNPDVYGALTIFLSCCKYIAGDKVHCGNTSNHIVRTFFHTQHCIDMKKPLQQYRKGF